MRFFIREFLKFCFQLLQLGEGKPPALNSTCESEKLMVSSSEEKME